MTPGDPSYVPSSAFRSPTVLMSLQLVTSPNFSYPIYYSSSNGNSEYFDVEGVYKDLRRLEDLGYMLRKRLGHLGLMKQSSHKVPMFDEMVKLENKVAEWVLELAEMNMTIIYTSDVFTWRVSAYEDDQHRGWVALEATQKQRRRVEKQYETLNTFHCFLEQRSLVTEKFRKSSNGEELYSGFNKLVTKTGRWLSEVGPVGEQVFD
ncbi:MAG: hypothetical protein Q9218_005126 [Villophora microphyllina]